MDDFEQLKRQVADITSKRDQAKGALDQVLKRLKKEFGCSTLEEAEALLIKRQEKERKVATEYTKQKEAFERKWKKTLEELDD